MKKFLLFLSLLCCQWALAGNVSEQEAMEKALSFLSKHTSKSANRLRAAVKTDHLATGKATPHYYVFDIDQQNGFVIVSADDRVPAILGYVDRGSFNSEEIPENMKAWLEGYAEQMEYLNSHADAPVARVQAEERNAVAPLLTSTWSQGDPYNRLCPMMEDKRCVTGCVATAMAQLLYYHKYPVKTLKGIPAYTTKTNKLYLDSLPVTTFDWEHMLDNYTGAESDTEINAVATLMRVCGAADEMDYSYNASNAHTEELSKIFKDYFDFDATTELVKRINYRAKEWDDIIYNELAHQRPVLYGGYTITSGHAFIVDGYDKAGLFHVNWGWSGSCDGYFLLSVLDPHDNSGIGASSSNGGYSIMQDALIGAKPNEGTVVGPIVRLSTESIQAYKNEIIKSNGEFKFTVNAGLFNRTGEEHNFDIGVGVYNTNNELVHFTHNYHSVIKNTYGTYSLDHDVTVPTLPDGQYIITLISREHGSTTWYQNACSEYYYLSTTISGDTLRMLNPSISMTGTIEVTGRMEAGETLQATINIKNNGSVFNNVIYLQVNGKEVCGRHFDIDEDSEDTLTMEFDGVEAGTNHVALGYDIKQKNETTGKWETVFMPIASTDIEVEASKPHTLTFSNGKVTNSLNKVIKSDTAKIQVTIKNDGDYDYDNDISILVFKQINPNTQGYSHQYSTYSPVTIAANSSITFNTSVPIYSDGVYWFIIVYKSNGQYIDATDGFKKLSGYTVKIPDEPSAIITTQSDTNDGIIYDLKGQRVTQPRKGLYIINGKKMVIE